MASISPVHQFNIKSKIKSLAKQGIGHWPNRALAKQGKQGISHWSLVIGHQEEGRREEDIHSNLFSDPYFAFN